jgi:hypothetical protein
MMQAVLLVQETAGNAIGLRFGGYVANPVGPLRAVHDVPESEVVTITRDPVDPCGEGPTTMQSVGPPQETS